MKTLKSIIVLLFLACLTIQPSHGQRFLKKISDKALKKAEQRLEKKADEKVDEELDKVEEKLEDKTSEEEDSSSENEPFNMGNIMSSMGLSGEPVPISDNYKFNQLIQMHIESTDKNGKKTSEGEFITYMNTNNKCMAYKSVGGNMSTKNQGIFIADMENEAMIMLNEDKGKKNGIVYGIKGFMQSVGETYSEEETQKNPETYLANPNVTKTGKTKTIAGLKCEEYLYKDENTKSNIWITNDLKLNTKDFFSSIYKTNIYSQGADWGYLMEATSVNTENGEKSFMQVTRIEEGKNISFSMNDYEITNLGSIEPMEQE